jgi:SAM-dependent methyltransferase
MQHATSQDASYVGSELELFSYAHNWKSYWQSKLAAYAFGDCLEVGGGIGANTGFFAAHCKSLTVLEPDALQAASIAKAFPAVRVLAKTIGDIDGQFDAIFYIDVLEHIEHDKAELEAAFARLGPGGVIAVLAPAYQALYSPFDKSIGHFRRYSKKTLTAIAPQNAAIKAAFYLDSAGCALSFANRWLLKQSLPTLSQIRFWDRAIIPLSRLLDVLCMRSFGKTIIVVFEKSGS